MVADGPIRVLFAEDDDRLARLTTEYLASHGLEVHLCVRGDAAVSEVIRLRPDVVLLDIMLPGASGLEVCRELRARSDVPIIMVTARTGEADRVVGLEGGADDYVAKPFQARELLARIRAQARRGRGEAGPRSERIVIGPLVVDAANQTVTLAGVDVALTAHELTLLHALAQRPGRPMDREQLLRLLHGSAENAFDRSIDVIVSRLRIKLGDDPRHPRLIRTVRGVGYVLTANAEVEPQ